MGVIGEPWAASPVHVIMDKDGNEVTLTIHEYGVTVADVGGASPLGLVEETDDPDVIRHAGRLFRAIAG